jgi:hypothetical protein
MKDGGKRNKTHGEARNAYKFVMRKPRGKRFVERCMHRWEDCITMHIVQVEC